MIKKILFWLGIAIVVITHIFMLTNGLPVSQTVSHSVINIVAAGFIIIGSL